MEKINMANMNTLFKKGYLLAGVVMAANMFAVNEVRASSSQFANPQVNTSTTGTNPNITQNKQEREVTTFDLSQNEGNTNNLNIIGGEKDHQKKQGPLDKLLSWENYFNFFGTLALSGANNYFKWWDYNAGSYCNLRIGCLGWRTKKFFDIVQLDFNLNLWRGIGWSIPHFIKFRQKLKQHKETEEKINEELNAEQPGEKEHKSGINADSLVSFLFKDILRGFVSISFTLHISNFSISISFDSILWEFVIGRFFDTDGNKSGKKIVKLKDEKNDN